MRISDALLETKIIQTICESKDFRPIILSQVDEDWFVSDAAKEVLKRVKFLIDSGKDIPSLGVLFCDQSLSEQARILLGTSNNVIQTESDVKSALELFRNYRYKKLLADCMMLCLQKLEDDRNLPNVLTMLENTLQKCTTNTSTQDEMKHHFHDDCAKLLNQADELLTAKNIDAIPSGFMDFDRTTGGIRRKNVLVLASVPGGGKSSMALQMAIKQYMMGYSVCIVSYEMPEEEIDMRLFSNVSKVNHQEINLKRVNKQKKNLILQRYAEWLEASTIGNKLTIWTPTRELTIPQIALELKPYKYDIIYIDYLSLLYQNPKKQMWENLGEHTRAAKIVATSLNAALVLLAQYDDESNKIKYAKSITANANFVWAWEYGDREKETGLIEVKQLKARNAPTYPFYLETDYSVFSFDDYRGPASPFEKFKKDDDNNDDGGKAEIKRRKKKLDEKSIAQKMQMQPMRQVQQMQTQQIPQTAPQHMQQSQIFKEQKEISVDNSEVKNTKRGIPKMPQLF